MPDACLRELAAGDLIVHAGDFVTVAVLEELSQLAPVAAVHGNVDERALQELLPRTRVVDVGELRIGIVHDAGPRAGRAVRLGATFPGCAAVVYGHSHLPEVSRHEAVWILNPGSPTERRRAPVRSMIRLEAAEGTLRPRLIELP